MATFDVTWGKHGPFVEPHFCRSWEIDESGEERGCYGTNPEHGLSLDQVADEMAEWHEETAKRWRDRTHPHYVYYKKKT